jgi:hypothetical protein
LAIESGEPNCCSSLNDAQGDSFITESNNLQGGFRRQTDKVSRINLNLKTRFAIGLHCVAFNQREIEPGSFGVSIPFSF